MNRANLSGTILEITQPMSFNKDGMEYKYRTVVIDVGENIIAANWWSDSELPQEGAKVEFTIELRSERNNKTPELFYHKLNLKSIYESHTVYSAVQYN